MEVEIRDLQGVRVDESLLRDAARGALTRAGGKLDTLSLALVDDDRMQALNRRYRSVNAPTDVIAFEADRQAEGAVGEVIVSVETAGRQAAEAGHSLERELCVLVAHGVLHVLGYQDADAEGTARMAALQDQVLSDMEESLQGHEH